MKKILPILACCFLLYSCASSDKKKVVQNFNQNIAGFEINVLLYAIKNTMSPHDDICEATLILLNKNSTKKEIYIELSAFNRKGDKFETLNFLFTDISKGLKIEQKDFFSKTKYCRTIKSIELFGG